MLLLKNYKVHTTSIYLFILYISNSYNIRDITQSSKIQRWINFKPYPKCKWRNYKDYCLLFSNDKEDELSFLMLTFLTWEKCCRWKEIIFFIYSIKKVVEFVFYTRHFERTMRKGGSEMQK